MPFEKIPGPSILDFIVGFAPTGKYSNLNFLQLSYKFREEFGNIIKLPGILGQKSIVFVYEPSDFETVFRSIGSGQWPIRNGNETFAYHRKHCGIEVFAETGGLIAEYILLQYI